MRDDSDAGSVLVFVLIVTMVTVATAFMMLTVTNVDALATSSYRDGMEAFYAADAALEASVDELAGATSWTPLLGGALSAWWSASTSAPATAFAGSLNLVAMTSALQTETNASAGLGANTPSWRLFGHGPISAIWPDAGPVGDVYVVVWAADDTGEGDGSPNIDANNTIQLRAEAYGRRSSRRIVEAVIARAASGAVRLVVWREIR